MLDRAGALLRRSEHLVGETAFRVRLLKPRKGQLVGAGGGSRRQSIRGHAGALELCGQPLDEGNGAAHGRGEDGVAHAATRTLGSGHDDPAPTAFDHARHGQAREPELLTEEQVHQLVVLLIGDVDLAGEHGARDGEDDVDRAEGLLGERDQVGASLGFGHGVVVGHRLAARRQDLGDGRVCGFGAPSTACCGCAQVVDYDPCALGGQGQRACLPDPVAATGHNGHFATQTVTHVLLLAVFGALGRVLRSCGVAGPVLYPGRPPPGYWACVSSIAAAGQTAAASRTKVC